MSLPINPKIDYVLLGLAVAYYRDMGYTYMEVPWAVEDKHVAATCPTKNRSYLVERRYDDAVWRTHAEPRLTDRRMSLVGSAEQGFLSLDLPPGQYVGVTPCFRVEPVQDIYYQPSFMKVELYDNTEYSGAVSRVKAVKLMMLHARLFMNEQAIRRVEEEETDIGFDLTLAGVEVGSYGHRVVEGYRPWVYGTGLALPRFSVARALSAI